MLHKQLHSHGAGHVARPGAPHAMGVGVEKLLGACRRYFDQTGRRISYEYAMISTKPQVDREMWRIPMFSPSG